MHPELAALLRHACRHPDDPAPRLVLADWLEEHGGESERDRARFLRLTCQIASLRPCQPQRAALAREAAALHDAHHAAWCGHLADHGVETWDFLPGLLALGLGPNAADRGRLDRIAADPAFAWACAVTCRGWRAALVKSLADWPGLAQIGRLGVTAVEGLTPRSLKALFAPGRLAGLRELDLERNDLNDPGAALVAHCPDLASLTSLSLPHNNIGTSGALELARSPHLAGLTSLNLDNNAIRDGGIEGLARAGPFPALRTLALESNELTTLGARALAQADGLPQLRSLGLGYNTLRSAGVEALAASPLAQQLESLSLRSAIAGPGTAALATAPLPHLRHLDLYHNGIEPAGLHALSLASWLTRLESLRLGGNRIGPEGARLLARRPGPWALRSLELGSTALGADGVEALLKGGLCSGLEELKLDNNLLDAPAARALARFDWPAEPPWIDLRHNRFSEADKALLRDRFAGRVAV